MKITKLIYLKLILSSLFLINSCSETTTTSDMPKIMSLSKTVAVVGDTLVISGYNFVSPQPIGAHAVCGGTQIINYISWSDSTIVFLIPTDAVSGQVVVIVNSKTSNELSITIHKNYFPSSVGNYWIYENFTLDDQGNKNLNSRIEDSTAITLTWELYGKYCDIYTHNYDFSTKEQYYYTENGKLYATVAEIMPEKSQMPLPIDVPKAWIVIADPDSLLWEVFSQTFNNEDIEIPNFGKGKLTGTFALKMEKGEKKPINTGENQTLSVMSQEYKTLYTFDGNIKVGIFEFPLFFIVTEHRWYGENIGLILQRLDSKTISLGGLYNYKIIGSESGMLRYHVSQ